MPMSMQIGKHCMGFTPPAAVYRVILPSLMPIPLRPRSPAATTAAALEGEQVVSYTGVMLSSLNLLLNDGARMVLHGPVWACHDCACWVVVMLQSKHSQLQSPSHQLHRWWRGGGMHNMPCEAMPHSMNAMSIARIPSPKAHQHLQCQQHQSLRQ